MSMKAAVPARPRARRGRAALGLDAGPSSLPGGYYSYAYADYPEHPGRETPLYPFRQSIFVRNNPHPGRVRHMKGLLDVPICTVQDARTEGYRRLMSPPTGDQSLHYSRFQVTGNTRYSANRSKHLPAVGVVPVTYAWRDELEAMAKRIVNDALSEQPEQGGSGYLPLASVRQSSSIVDENKVLELMCRILQTDSLPTVQHWLNTASNSEKDIVLNMLRMATTGELAYTPPVQPSAGRPSTSGKARQPRYCYNWQPSASRVEQRPDPQGEDDLAPPELPKHSLSRSTQRPATTASTPRAACLPDGHTSRRTMSAARHDTHKKDKETSIGRLPTSAKGRVKYVDKWSMASSQP